MYRVMVITLMFAFPIASIIVELALGHHGVSTLGLVGKWFVFWASGVRLTTAGLKQIIQPNYTAGLLGIKSADVLIVIRELGFANLSIGSIGVISLFMPAWTLPAAVAAACFYGLAGINHIAHTPRTRAENVAMASDLFVAAALWA